MEARPEELEGVSYQKAFRDVRRAVDLCAAPTAPFSKTDLVVIF